MKYAIKLFNDNSAKVVGVDMSGDKSRDTAHEFTNCYVRVDSKNTHIVRNWAGAFEDNILLTLPSKDVISTFVEDEQAPVRDINLLYDAGWRNRGGPYVWVHDNYGGQFDEFDEKEAWEIFDEQQSKTNGTST